MLGLDKRAFAATAAARYRASIDGDRHFYRLASSYWVYDEFLRSLSLTGWARFAAGFKAGLYAHPEHPWAIKVIGMGVGEDPLYFAERGYYLAYERQMLDTFWREGFTFAPQVMPLRRTVEFLVGECGVSREQAVRRCSQHDLLVMERIDGVALATQTGHALDYEADIAQFNGNLIGEAIVALSRLRRDLCSANKMGLLHNDAMPGNIVFSMNNDGALVARLVDFELAQDLWMGSPPYVNNSVTELYELRGVPRDVHTGRHTMTLDEYLTEASLRALEEVRQLIALPASGLASVPFIGGLRLRLPAGAECSVQGKKHGDDTLSQERRDLDA
jgi:serine/threonine protein kinase